MNDNINYMALAGIKGEANIPINGYIGSEEIVNIVCDYFNVNVESVLGKRRNTDLVEARQISMYFLRKIKRLPLKKIGEIMGGKDHTTVLHSLNHVNDYMETEDDFKANILILSSQIRSKIQIPII